MLLISSECEFVALLQTLHDSWCSLASLSCKDPLHLPSSFLPLEKSLPLFFPVGDLGIFVLGTKKKKKRPSDASSFYFSELKLGDVCLVRRVIELGALRPFRDQWPRYQERHEKPNITVAKGWVAPEWNQGSFPLMYIFLETAPFIIFIN